MLRLMGSLLVIGGCSGFAGSICRELDLRLRMLKQIRSIYENMKYYISYEKAAIPEALLKISGKEGGAFGEAFEAVYQGIYEGNVNFSPLWREEMDKVLLHTPLKQRERKLLYDFPSCLGFLEEKAQARALEELLREASLQIEELEQEKRNKNKMVMSLGVSVGILISILLL